MEYGVSWPESMVFGGAGFGEVGRDGDSGDGDHDRVREVGLGSWRARRYQWWLKF